MPVTELFVGLKVPDNVAITAFNTLHRMRHNYLRALERRDYYKFEFSGNKKQFEKKIRQVDILINSNKNNFSFSLKNNKLKDNKINVLIENSDKDNDLLKVLKQRLNFNNIRKLDKGILWTMYFDDNINAENKAVEITKNLLMNENYQKFKIVK